MARELDGASIVCGRAADFFFCMWLPRNFFFAGRPRTVCVAVAAVCLIEV